MSKNRKIRVAVLYGGRSGEHEVSLRSATNVIKNLDRSRFEVVPIGINKQGTWFLGEDLSKDRLEQTDVVSLQQDIEKMLFTPSHIAQPLSRPSDLIPTQNSERLFDVVFPVIHGVLCEDGTVQGLLELADLPYVGCGVLSSAVGMEKDVSKRLVMNAGIRVAPYLVAKRGQWDKNPNQFCDMVKAELSFPVFVKPANTGSSVGVHKVKNPAALAAAINDAFRYDTKILVEQGIVEAREIEVSVLESLDYGADPLISEVGEITPQNGHEFYSYASKYLDPDGAGLLIPAPVSPELKEEIIATVKKIFAVLECEGMARVDLLVERKTNRVYFNEVNTIPGFTQISMYPKLMEASGVKYSDLLSHLIDLAIARHSRTSKLAREYIADEVSALVSESIDN